MNAKSRKPNKQSHIGTKNISTKTEKPIYKIAKTGLRKQVFAKLDNKPRTTTATLLIRDLLKSHAVSVNVFLTAVSHCTPINTSVIYTRTHALFAARMSQHATSQDVPTQTRTNFLI